jgi:hypothetical protein
MENKRITPEDLMIGDWVLMDMNYDSDYEFDNVNYQPYQIKTGEDIDLAIESNMMATDAIYRGIQITHELLEKNGYKFNHLWYEKKGFPAIEVGFEDGTYNVGKVYFYGNGNPYIHICGTTCQYVHELQRIFKVQHISAKIIL